MKFPPIFHNSEEIQKRMHELDVLNKAIHYIPVEPTMLHFLREKSLLKSALYSARIEGNSLTLDELARGVKSVRHKEVININRALTFVERTDTRITSESIKKLHAMILDGISADAGLFRSEESAVFNQAGIAVYLAPPPKKVKSLLSDLSLWIMKNHDATPITAAIAHVWFEKIHPFLDGNGRVGRALAQWILMRGEYRFTGVLPFEEYLDTHRQEYYDALMVDKQDVTAFVEFFINALIIQAHRTLEELKHPTKEIVSLLPRRAELLNVIRDHPMTTFDFLHRRFLAVPVSTLHNDLKQLIKTKHIQKLGSTRGVVYVSVEGK